MKDQNVKCEKCKNIINNSNYADHIYNCFDWKEDTRSKISNIVLIRCQNCKEMIEEKCYDDHLLTHGISNSLKKDSNLGFFEKTVDMIKGLFFMKDKKIEKNEAKEKSLLDDELNNVHNLYFDTENETKIKNSLAENISSMTQSQDVFLDNRVLYEDLSNSTYHNEMMSIRQHLDTGIAFSIQQNDNNYRLGLNSYEEMINLDENNTKKCLKASFIEKLPIEEMSLSNFKKLNNNEKKCVICFSDFKLYDKLIRLPCLHLFHKDEIEEWFKSNKTCPICKIDIEEILMKMD